MVRAFPLKPRSLGPLACLRVKAVLRGLLPTMTVSLRVVMRFWDIVGVGKVVSRDKPNGWKRQRFLGWLYG